MALFEVGFFINPVTRIKEIFETGAGGVGVGVGVGGDGMLEAS